MAVVGLRIFGGDAIQVVDLALDKLERTVHKCLERRLVVRFQQKFDMAKPCDVTTDKIGRKLVFIIALHRDDMTEDTLGHGATHDEALHDVALLACNLECSFPSCSLRELDDVLAGLKATD